MAAFSTLRVLDGVCLTLRDAFPEAHIEADSVPQGLALPAFLATAAVSQKTYPGGRHLRTTRVTLHYLPRAWDAENPQTGGRSECLEVGDALFSLLEVIALPGGEPLRGTNLHYELSDGVLRFFADYSCFVTPVQSAAPMMETLDTLYG